MTRRATIVGPPPTAVPEVRHGRNWLRRGDLVRVRLGHRWQLARFIYADEDRGGAYYHVQLLHGAPSGRLIPGNKRFLRPDVVRRTRLREPAA